MNQMVEKEGRRLSAATKAKLEEAIEHGDAMIALLKLLLASDDEATAAALARTWASALRRTLN